MKKLLGFSIFVLILSACSQTNNQPQGTSPDPEVKKALQECQQEVGQAQDQVKFDTCMRQKGFERPENPM